MYLLIEELHYNFDLTLLYWFYFYLAKFAKTSVDSVLNSLRERKPVGMGLMPHPIKQSLATEMLKK